MRRTLGVLSLLLVLAACGEDAADDGPGDGTGTDPATESTSPTPTPGPTPTSIPTHDAAGTGLVAILHETAAGGDASVGDPAVRIDNAAGLREFSGRLDGGQLARDVESIAARVRLRDGQGLYAAVVAIGCDVPDDATARVEGSVVTITAAKIIDPMLECFAPVTSVAVMTVETP